MPMMLIVDYEPTYSAHISSSALCATCHTVIVPSASGEVVEQATFLEWRSSSVAATQTCQTCHMPSVDTAGAAISTAIASFPATLGPRQPVSRHDLVGGNAYMLRVLADAVDWAGAGIDKSELEASAQRDEAHLATAARVSLANVHREGNTLIATVNVENRTGHKLPTGYPSRRVWIHVTVRAGASVVFESGAPAQLPDEQPHYDEITTPDQVQIYEATLVDLAGKRTHRALDARHYSKDNRILPAGFSPQGTDKTRTLPVGPINDATFIGGSDEVTYRMAAPAGATIDVELLYTSVRPDVVDAIEAAQTPAGVRFVELARARPITPTVLATATATAQ
jgi:hypothetical protein